MTRSSRNRVPARTRWWWIAPVASSDGAGTRSALVPRSESTSTFAPVTQQFDQEYPTVVKALQAATKADS